MSFEAVRKLMEFACDEVHYHFKFAYVGDVWPLTQVAFFMRGGILAHPKKFPYLESGEQISVGVRVDDFYTIVLGVAHSRHSRMLVNVTPYVVDGVLDEYTGTKYQLRGVVQQSSVMQTEEMYRLTACMWLSRIGFDLTQYFQRASQFELDAQDVKRMMADDVSRIINGEVWRSIAVGIHRVISLRAHQPNIEHILQELQ